MPVRSLEVYLNRLSTNGAVQVLYEVPADRTLIVKQAYLGTQGGSGTTFLLVNGPGFPTLITAGVGAIVQWPLEGEPGWGVLREGRQLVLFGPGGGNAVQCDVWVSGALLAGDAS